MKKRGRGAIIAVFLVAIVIFGLIYEAWNTVTTVFEPPAPGQAQSVTLSIQPGETTTQIADDLYKKGLIHSTLAFIVWARVKGLDKTLEAGVYTLTPGTNIDGIIAKLQNGQPDAKNLLVQDGWRLEQIANAADGVVSGFSKIAFLNWTRHPKTFPDYAKYPLLQGRATMEGLLFPDTYAIPVNYNTTQIIDLMLTEMVNNVQPLIAAAKTHKMDVYQMITLASIVEREASNDRQMPKIAGIYWNRLFTQNDETVGEMASDPTVEYAYDTDHPPAANSHYWVDLNNRGTGKTVDVNSPWNTYTHKGLPPTPISAPKLSALKAAAAPASTPCYFFYTQPKTGALVCEATQEQITADEQRDHLNQ